VIGTRGDFRISANEVAIGLKLPRVAAIVLRHRLNPAAYQRAATLAENFDVNAALQAGFFDELVESENLLSRAEHKAESLLNLDAAAHTATKKGLRRSTVRKIRRSLPLDLFDAVMTGLRRKGPKS
jgi:enoyl-CoA hydratase